MAGFFTLDSESLGVLDSNIIGGFGFGFVTGSVNSDGLVSGRLGFAGSISGNQSTTGIVSGFVNKTGTVVGIEQSSGLLIGFANFFGAVAASESADGFVTGSAKIEDAIASNAISLGSVSGVPALRGSASGESASSGAILENATQPPPYPQPQPEQQDQGGGFSARWFIPPKLRIRQVSGRIIARESNSGGLVYGNRTDFGSIDGSVSVSYGVVRGIGQIIIPILIPPRNAVRERQLSEDDFFVLVDF